MWLLYFKLDLNKINYYGFCLKRLSDEGYRFKDLNQIIKYKGKPYSTAEISLRKNIKKTKKDLEDYLHTFDDRVDWHLFSKK